MLCIRSFKTAVRVHIKLPVIYLTQCSKATAVIFLLCILLLSPTSSLFPSISFFLHPLLFILGVESNTNNIIINPTNICFIYKGYQVFPGHHTPKEKLLQCCFPAMLSKLAWPSWPSRVTCHCLIQPSSLAEPTAAFLLRTLRR